MSGGKRSIIISRQTVRPEPLTAGTDPDHGLPGGAGQRTGMRPSGPLRATGRTAPALAESCGETELADACRHRQAPGSLHVDCQGFQFPGEIVSVDLQSDVWNIHTSKPDGHELDLVGHTLHSLLNLVLLPCFLDDHGLLPLCSRFFAKSGRFA